MSMADETAPLVSSFKGDDFYGHEDGHVCTGMTRHNLAACIDQRWDPKGDDAKEQLLDAELIEWKADRVGKAPGHSEPGEWDAVEFIHHDREIVEHWVLHQRMRKPGVLYEIYEVTTVLRETL